MLDGFIHELFSFIFEQINDIDYNNPQNSNPYSNNKANHNDLDSNQFHIMTMYKLIEQNTDHNINNEHNIGVMNE
jgi:hypothetical protein